MTSSDFTRDLVLALPPMTSDEWSATKRHLAKLASSGGESDGGGDAVQKEHDKRICNKQNCGDSEDGSSSALVKAMRSALKDHQEKEYKNKSAVTGRYDVEERTDAAAGDGGKKTKSIVIRTYAEFLAPQNHCTGHWATEFEVDATEDLVDAQMRGYVDVHAHYDEDGANVQFRTRRRFEAESVHGSLVQRRVCNVQGGDGVETFLADAVAKQLGRFERQLYEDTVCAECGADRIESRLKKIRRILPITKTRFKWDSGAQGSVQLLNQTK